MWQYFLGVNSFFFLLFLIAFVYFKRKERIDNFVKNFDSYAAILTYHMNRAFDIVYKESIFVYSLDGYKLNEEELNKTSKDFVQLVVKLLGPTLKKELTFVYGDEETLFFNILEYFNVKYEEDQVRKMSIEEIKEGEENVTSLF